MPRYSRDGWSVAFALMGIALGIRAVSAVGHCGDGVRSAADGEACDDGNVFSGDGCSSTCAIEDPTTDVWLCDAQDGALTACCRTRTNPVTGLKACNCVGQAPAAPGYTVTPECEERDVDECASALLSLCHQNAVCENLDGTLRNGTHRCTCPPGMLGDGVSRCDVNTYTSRFVFGIAGTPPASADGASIVSGLYTTGVIPAWVEQSRVEARLGVYRPDFALGRRTGRSLLEGGDAGEGGESESASEGGEDANETESGGGRSLLWRRAARNGAAGAAAHPHAPRAARSESRRQLDDGPLPDASRRQLGSNPLPDASRRQLDDGPLPDASRRQLENGTEVTIVITSDSPGAMDNTTGSISMSSLDPLYTPLLSPTSEVSILDTAFAPVEVDTGGFTVDTIAYSKVNYKWVITARYRPNVPDTVTGIYVSKVGPPPYSAAVSKSFYPSQHPCVLSQSVCCLNDWKSNYMVGGFADNVTQAIGACGPAVQAQATLGMFDPSADEAAVDALFRDYPNSEIHRTNPDRIQLVIAETDLRNSFSTREDIVTTTGQTATGYRLEFFVGMAYYTMLPASAISTTVSQTRITVTVTDSLTFSLSTKQDYTFLRYMTFGLYQNRWVDGLQVREMQFARVSIVLPVGMNQNTDTGLIPLGSIRFAVSQSLPDQMDQSKWYNPCYSQSGTGMWDAGMPWRDMYDSAASQTCAMQHRMCSNPLAQVLASNVVDFYFPIGEGTINATHWAQGAGYSLYVYFDISARDGTGRVVTTRLFAQSSITELSIARACESLQATLSLLELTSIDMAIGVVGNEQDWNTSVHTFDNVRQASAAGSVLDTTALVSGAPSLQSGLISLAIRGEPDVFASPLTSAYYIDIEHLTTLHFLDNAKFVAVRDIMAQTGNAFTVVKDAATDTISIELSQAVWSACSNFGGAVSCAVRHDIVKGQVAVPFAVHQFATGPSATDATATRDWLTKNILGVSEFSNELASNMTALVRSKFAIDDRIHRAWYINPGHVWPRLPGSSAQSTLLLSDKLIAVAVVALRDGSGSIVRRRLMSTTVGGTAARSLLQQSPATNNPVLMPSSGDAQVLAAIEAISNAPRSEVIPPINYGVDVESTVAQITGAAASPAHGAVRVTFVGRFPSDWGEDRFREAIAARIRANSKMYCPTCTGVFPVFYDVDAHPAGQPGGGGRRRSLLGLGGQAVRRGGSIKHEAPAPRPRDGVQDGHRRGKRDGHGKRRSLLQAASSLPAMNDFRGTVDVAVSFSSAQGNQVVADELFRSLLRDTYTSGIATDPSASIKSLAGGEIVVSSVGPASWAGESTAYVVRGSERLASSGGSLTATWDPVANPWGAPPPGTPAPPTGNATNATNATAAPPLTPEELNALEIARLMGVLPTSSGAIPRPRTALDAVFLTVAFVAASICIFN